VDGILDGHVGAKVPPKSPVSFAIFTPMKRFLSILLLSSVHLAWAQNDPHFLHGFGYDYSIGVPRNNAGQLFIGNGLSYVPRYVKPLNDDLSLGLSAPFGGAFVQSMVTGAGAFGANYAVCAEFAAGMGSTQSSSRLLGAFFGLGFGSYDVYYFDVFGTTRDAHYGPYVQTGVRIPYYGQDVTVVLSNWRGMNAKNGRSQVFALKLIYEFF
jgi:hypothetical protein